MSSCSLLVLMKLRHCRKKQSTGMCVPGMSLLTASANASMAGLVCSKSLMSLASSSSYRPSQLRVNFFVKSRNFYEQEDIKHLYQLRQCYNNANTVLLDDDVMCIWLIHLWCLVYSHIRTDRSLFNLIVCIAKKSERREIQSSDGRSLTTLSWEHLWTVTNRFSIANLDWPSTIW